MVGKHQVEPLFVKHNIKFSSKKPISHCQIQNGVVLLGLQSQSLQHVRIQTGKFTDIPLNLASNDRIAHIHLDYRGSHALISTELGENYYMNMKTVAVKPLWRLKGHTITAVGFNAEKATDQETSFIVLGTNKGQLWETNIVSSGSVSYLKALSSSLVENAPISSIHIIPYSLDNDLNWLMIVCTPGRLYCIPGTLNVEAMEKVTSQRVVGTVYSTVFVEQQTAVLQNFFSSKSNPRYHSLGDQKDEKPSDVVIFPTCIEETSLPERYAWLAAEGISLGHFENTRTDGFDIINEDWFRKHDLSEGKYNYPMNIVLSEYHIFMIYQEKFVAVSILDQKVAFEDVFMDSSNILGMCRDATSEFIWIYSESGLFYYRPDRETRDVWKVLIDRNEFSKARKIAKQMSDKRPYQVVLKKEAEKFLNENNFVAAAELLAQSTEPFENTVLKFMKNPNSRDSRNGLKRYLELKLDALDKRDKVKRDILVIWLLEVQLSELAELRRSASKQEDPPLSPVGHKDQLAKKLREELFCFLNRAVVNECILDNRAAVYRLISTHVDFDTYLFLANKLKDYEVVVKVHLLQGEFEPALEVASAQSNPQLIYKYAQDFFDNVPKLFIKTLIEQKELIRPNQVITSFFKCTQSPEKIATAFAYLNFVVNEGKADRTVLDFLIKLLAEYKPKQLLENLKKFGKSREFVKYDVERALRLCLEKKLDECAVFLYCLEGLYEDAVEKALTIDIKLAKECAKELDNEEHPDLLLLGNEVDLNFGAAKVSKETKKRVWLKIVKHMIQNNAEVGECTAMLKESGNVIRIQDILPLFPEFTKIEHFKQPLCECLKEHSKQISELQKEIQQATESVAQIRTQTEKLSSNILVVKSGDKCAICSTNLLLAPFFAFNCRHFFHQDCLIEYLEGIFTEKEKKLYSKMKEHEKSLKTEIALKSGKERIEIEQTLAKLKTKMTEFTCRECPFCSQQRIIQLLQTPLISEEEYEKLSADWVL